jgi:hypothetical protein
MAQVSMTALEPRLTSTRVPVYNSGRTAFNRIRELLESLPQPVLAAGAAR